MVSYVLDEYSFTRTCKIDHNMLGKSHDTKYPLHKYSCSFPTRPLEPFFFCGPACKGGRVAHPAAHAGVGRRHASNTKLYHVL